jgi:hypothetical protein
MAPLLFPAFARTVPPSRFGAGPVVADRLYQPMLRCEIILRTFFTAVASAGFTKASLPGRPAILPINAAPCDAKWGNKLAKAMTWQEIPPWHDFRHHLYRQNGVEIYVN